EGKYIRYIIGIEEYRGMSWMNILQKVEEYIIENDKRPSERSKDIKIKKMGIWINHQIQTFKNRLGLMRNIKIYKKWKNFKDTYIEFFLSIEEKWKNKLANIIKYTNKNKKIPSCTSK